MGGALATGNREPELAGREECECTAMCLQVQRRLGDVPAARSFSSQRYCCDCSPQGSCGGAETKWAGHLQGGEQSKGSTSKRLAAPNRWPHAAAAPG